MNALWIPSSKGKTLNMGSETTSDSCFSVTCVDQTDTIDNLEESTCIEATSENRHSWNRFVRLTHPRKCTERNAQISDVLIQQRSSIG